MPLSPNFQFAAPSKEQVAAPDYAEALAKGMEVGFMPAFKSSDLLSKMLQAKMTEPYARRADEYFDADILAKKMGGALQGIQMQKALMDLAQARGFNNLLNSSSPTPGPSAPTPEDNYSPDFGDQQPPISASNPYPVQPDETQLAPGSQSSTVVNPGNPDLYHIDEAYDKNPYYRKNFHERGFVKKETVKTDPRTGITSTTIQYPSGKVEVKTTSGASGPVPLTNQLKTLHQNIVSGVPKVMDSIDEIIKSPSPLGIPGVKSDQQAKHKALVNAAAETYAKAKGWPNTNESIHRATQILGRGLFESDDSYRARLRDVKRTLEKDKADSQRTLRRGSTEDVSSSAPSSGVLTYNPSTGRLE